MTATILAILVAATCLAPAPIALSDASTYVPAATKSYHITQWTLDDGLPQSTVTAIAQARDGYLWLGTFGGLVRFDGVRLRTFTVEDTPGLSSNRIVSLLVDHGGTLWVGTENGGLLYQTKDGFKQIIDPHDSGIVWQIVQDRTDDIWIRGRDLIRIHDGQWTKVEPFADNVHAPVSTIHTDALGRLWIGSIDRLLRIDSADTRTFSIAPLHGDRLAIVTNDDNQAWLIASNGIARLDDTGRCEVLLDQPTALPACGILDWQGDLIFPHRDSGFGVLRNGKALSPVRIESRPTNMPARIGLRVLIRTNEGILWVGTNIGLLRLSREPFQHVGNEMRLGHGAQFVTSDGLDGVYIRANSPNRILHWDGVRIHRYESDALTSLGSFKALCGTAHGLLLSNEDETLCLSAAGADPVVGIGPSQAAVTTPNGDSWFLCGHLLRRQSGSNIVSVEVPGRKICTRPTTMLSCTSDGAIWMADGLHLVRFDPRQTPDPFTIYSAADGLPGTEIRGIHQDDTGTIWLSTYGEGLFRLKDRGFTQIGTAQGLPDANLGGMLEDDNDRLWINSNHGVLVIPLASLNAVAEHRQKRVTCHQLATGEVNGGAACRTPDGKMWFPTIDDLVITDPSSFTPNPIPPRVEIESVEADGAPTTIADGVRTGMSGSNFQFEYTAFSYAHPDQLRFRYRLENYDNDWHDAGGRRAAYYTGLPPGNYVFRVLAANEDGVWSKAGARMPLQILPQFHETPTFRIGVVAGVIALLLLAHRQRISTHRRHARALAAEIEQRERSEIEQRRLEKMLRESTKLEAVGRLAGGIAHDFNNVLAAIMGSTEVLRHELTQKADGECDCVVSDSLDCITASSQRAAALTKQLLAYGRRQLLRPTVIDANEVITRLRPMLRQLLPKEIELGTQLANEPAYTRVDVTQLEQVVMNLVLNARDAINSGGTIEIRTELIRPGDGDRDQTRSTPDTPRVVIAISDNGEGISDERLPHIFEPFYTTRFEKGGAGLGLATVQGVVYQSGGHIVVDNRSKPGTTFRIYLPYAESGEMEPATDATGDVRGGDETILLCEHDDAVRRLARRVLERAGYTVLDANLPSRARELALNGAHIDLLITDVVMPGEDGFALSTAFRQSHPDAKTLFVSGYANVIFELPELADANARFLGKPFLSETLLREVRRILDSE